LTDARRNTREEKWVVKITEVRIKLMANPNDRLQAFCSVTFDHSFVIRDLKIIQGTKGSFVAMPSRKLTDRCPNCEVKNHLRAAYCNGCGASLDTERAVDETDGRAKLYADIAHPINSECRELIQECVVTAFKEELVKFEEANYSCRYDDYGEENYARLKDQEIEEAPQILPISAHTSFEETSSHRIDAAHDETRDAHVAEQHPQQQIHFDSDGESFGAGVI